MPEPIPEPIIDAHHHIWRLAATPWLQGPPVPRIFGDYAALRRDYTIEDYLADARPQGMVRSVFVQANVGPREEAQEVALGTEAAARTGFPQAITAFADLGAADADAALDAVMAAGRVVGIRQQLHWHANPAWRFAATPDAMDDPAWRAGLAAVERRGLLFELQVFRGQMAHALGLVRAFPGLTFVLLHAGMLEDRSLAGWAEWRAGMQALAGCPNLLVKLSGLGTFPRACSVALWRPVVEETVAIFGAGRCMFGSNFPIERLWTDYATLVAVMGECLAGASAEERRAIWHDTAARAYRL